MTWNHRVFRRHTGCPDEPYFYEIHEVYYDDNGEIDTWTIDAVAPIGETLEVLIKDIEWFRKATEQPVLDMVELDAMIAERTERRQREFDEKYGLYSNEELTAIINKEIEDICTESDADSHCCYDKGHSGSHRMIPSGELLQDHLYEDRYPSYPVDRVIEELP